MGANKIEAISADFFLAFPNLTRLDLSSNNLFALKQTYFLHLDRLENLLLSNNLILTIEKDCFALLLSLDSLDLGQNIIYELDFNLSRQLRYLNLRENQLEILTNNDIEMLNFLDLSYNKLNSLANFSFKRLDTLILSHNDFSGSVDSSLNQISNLDVSFTRLVYYDFSRSENLVRLDMSHNSWNENVTLARLTHLEFLNVSSTSPVFVLNLDLNSNLSVLDMSHNTLTSLDQDFFTTLVHLKELYLKNTNLVDFEFLTSLVYLEVLDMGDNVASNLISSTQRHTHLKCLRFSNASLKSYEILFDLSQASIFKIMDLSNNKLNAFIITFKALIHLDLSNNDIKQLGSDEVETTLFMTDQPYLNVINLRGALNEINSNKVFYFNRLLEHADLGENGLEVFPKFCHLCFEYICLDNGDAINLECHLKVVNFDSNRLTAIYYSNLNELSHLEHLNLANNCLESIEVESFSNLAKLETLILSHNALTLNSSGKLSFDELVNLRHLNLSSNLIELLGERFLSQLFKLEVVDLYMNRIRWIEDFAFHRLTYLKSLYLHDNQVFGVNYSAFFQLDSIQNVFMDKSVFESSLTRAVVLKLFAYKNSLFFKRSLRRTYFKSLFIISSYVNDTYDCELTLYFIRNNVHFNFRSESEIFDYFDQCDQIRIKNATAFEKINIVRSLLIFSDAIFYFFLLTLSFVLLMGFVLCLKRF